MKKTKTKSLSRAIRDFDFEDFLRQHSVDVEMKSSQVAGICPFCNHKRQSFYVNPNNGRWICHYCDERGGAVALIKKILDCSVPMAMDKLFDNFAVFVEEEKEYKEIEVATIELPDEYTPLPDDSSLAYPYTRYAAKRGLGDKLLKTYNIGYALSGRYRGRLIVPVYHFGGLVTFVARAVSKKAEVKVLTPFDNEQYRYLFNMDNLWGQEEVIVMEGVFDALTLPEMAVATFGKKITDEQAALLLKAGVRKVTFCYDDDATDDAVSFAQKYYMTFKTSMIELPKHDPSKLGRAKMLELLETAKPMKPNYLRV